MPDFSDDILTSVVSWEVLKTVSANNRRVRKVYIAEERTTRMLT